MSPVGFVARRAVDDAAEGFEHVPEFLRIEMDAVGWKPVQVGPAHVSHKVTRWFAPGSASCIADLLRSCDKERVGPPHTTYGVCHGAWT